MKHFRDLDQLRDDMRSAIPLNELIEVIDGKQLERVNDRLYKKRCDLDSHPMDKDGTKDSTPSFTVCPQKNLWHCFGCNSSGDHFEYVSRKLHVDHIESIYKVAEIMAFDLTPYYSEQTPEDEFRDSLFRENSMARNIAHENLLADKKAREYLLGRGISMDSIEEFLLGYAPPLHGDKITCFDDVPNRISLQLDRKDQFNDAILFPVCDAYGRMRYFQSRQFTPMIGMKYIGGRDTHPLYDEDDRLFGLSVARKKVREFRGRMIGVEGAPDAIVCNQHGIPAIASLGTAVSQKLFDILDKYRVSEFVLVLDGDVAGWNASIGIAEKYLSFNTKVRLKIVMMPEGDPDEYINKHGASALITLIDNAPLAIEHLINAEYKNIQPDTPTKKIEFLSAMEKYMAGIHDALSHEILLQYIATKIGFAVEEIREYYIKNTTDGSTIICAIDEEEVLLAEAIRDPDFILELGMRFKVNDWFTTRHRELYSILQSSQYSDIDTIFQIAKNHGKDGLLTYEWLSKLGGIHGNVEFCLDDVEDKLIRRRAKERLAKLDTELSDMSLQPSISIDRGMGDIYNTAVRRTEAQVFTGAQQANSVMKLVHERMKNPGAIIGYDLGPNFQNLTRALLGLQTKTLTVVAANQSVGKTQICQNWAMDMSVVQGIPTLWFTLEMDTDRMTFRNLSLLSGIPLTPLLTGNITMDDATIKLNPWAMKLHDAPFYMSEVGHDVTEALAIARRYVMSQRVKVIFVDYVQLQYYGGLFGKKRYEELGMISKAWKQFAKEMDVAVVLISQLSKEALKEEIAKAEHGSGSYEIAQDADNYLTLKEMDPDDVEQNGIEHGNIIGNLDKNRMGCADILLKIYSERITQRMMEVS